MATTPEGKVKKAVNSMLTLYPNIYKFMPVQAGFGAPTLDYLGCHWGRFFAIETKAAGKKLTKMQERSKAQIEAAGGKVFVIIGDAGLEELARWLEDVEHAARGSLAQTQDAGAAASA